MDTILRCPKIHKIKLDSIETRRRGLDSLFAICTSPTVPSSSQHFYETQKSSKNKLQQTKQQATRRTQLPPTPIKQPFIYIPYTQIHIQNRNQNRTS